MRVIGLGIDLVDLAELRRLVDDPRDPFIPRCFVQSELEEVGEGPDRLETLAGRFAAKEAVLKALGTGYGAGIAFTDVITSRMPGAAPAVALVGGASAAAAALGVTGWCISISHAGGMAVAIALALG